MELLNKLGQRETWLYAAGIGVSVSKVVLEANGLPAPDTETTIGIVAALLGPGAYAHVKRGEQRGHQAAEAVAQSKKRAALPEDEEGPWD